MGGLRPRQFANAELFGTMFNCLKTGHMSDTVAAQKPKSGSGSYLFGCFKVFLKERRRKTDVSCFSETCGAKTGYASL